MNNRLASLVAAVPIVVLPVVLCGCHHQPPVVRPSLTRAAAAAPVPVATPRPHPAAAPAPRPLTEDEVFASTSLDALNAQKPLADAFFDYDSPVLRADARESLAKDAKWLQRWSSTKVTVSGHCDERGTAEYNLALGEERAAAVKDYLQSIGVAADRITTVSYGKERPFCTAGGESCWSQNRRGHFVVTAK